MNIGAVFLVWIRRLAVMLIATVWCAGAAGIAFGLSEGRLPPIFVVLITGAASIAGLLAGILAASYRSKKNNVRESVGETMIKLCFFFVALKPWLIIGTLAFTVFALGLWYRIAPGPRVNVRFLFCAIFLVGVAHGALVDRLFDPRIRS